MKNYELLYIVSNQYTEIELEDIKKHVNELLEKQGGVIGYQDTLGKKKLAYPINKNAYGYYIIEEFELEDGSKIDKINNELKLDKQILRALVIAKDKITQEEIDRKKARAAKEAAQAEEKAETEKTEEAKPVKKPTKTATKKPMKNLDEKLDELLKDDMDIK